MNAGAGAIIPTISRLLDRDLGYAMCNQRPGRRAPNPRLQRTLLRQAYGGPLSRKPLAGTLPHQGLALGQPQDTYGKQMAHPSRG